TNRKAPARKGKVQLINATTFWRQMRRSLGDKRREIPEERAREIVDLLREFKEGELCKIFPTSHFGYRKITVDRPLRLNFQITPERIARLDDESGFRKVATSKKKNEKERLSEIAAGTERQQQIKTFLTDLGAKHDKAFLDRDQFREFIEDLAKKAKLRIDSAALKAIVNVLSERDENAPPCRDSDGAIEPDPELRDT